MGRRVLAVPLAALMLVPLMAVVAGCIGGGAVPSGGVRSVPTIEASGCGSGTAVVAAVLPLAWRAVACASPAPTAPAGGLTEAEAIKAALQLAPPSWSSAGAEWARFERWDDGLNRTAAPVEQWAWVVGLFGDFEEVACPAASAPPRPCGPASRALAIAIDYYTGAFLESSPY